MKLNILTAILLFYLTFTYAQKNTIRLPIIDSDVSFTRLTPIFNIHIDKNETIFLGENRVNIDELGDSIYKHRNKLDIDVMLRLQVHLLADKKVKYSFIDRVKTELTSAWAYNLVYRTFHIEDVSKGIVFFRLHNKFGALSYIEDEINKDKEVIEDDGSIEIELPFSDPEEIIFKNKLYELKLKEAKEDLKKFSYSTIKFINGKKVVIDNKKYRLNDSLTIKELIERKRIILASFSKEINYEDYLKNIITFKKIYRENEKKGKHVPYFLEISGELQRELDKRKIKF